MTTAPNAATVAPAARIWVLGAGGFLGSHLVEALLKQGRYRITAVDTSFAKLPPRLQEQGRLTRVEASIADTGVLAAAVDESDVVLSLTALCNPALYNTRPLAVIDANYTHLVPLVERCAAARRWLVHFSTCEVYGRSLRGPAGLTAPMREDDSPLVLGSVAQQRWTYASAKQLLERLIWAYGAEQGLPFTIVRPFNVIGPRMDFIDGIDGVGTPRVLACFMAALLGDEPLCLVDGGEQRRAFIAVQDFTEAILRLVARPRRCQGEIINLGHPGNDVSIAELAARMAEVFQERHAARRATRIAFERVSAVDFYGVGYDDTNRRIPDIGKARRLLDWEPTTSLAQMLPTIVDDYVARYGEAFRGVDPREPR